MCFVHSGAFELFVPCALGCCLWVGGDSPPPKVTHLGVRVGGSVCVRVLFVVYVFWLVFVCEVLSLCVCMCAYVSVYV